MEFEIDFCTKCTENNLNFEKVPLIQKSLLYNEFFKNYMQPNIPCLIRNLTDDWEAHSKWITEDQKPNINYLKKQYGSYDVTLYNCNEKYFNSQKTEDCKLETFLEEIWNTTSSKLKYLKDWHLKNTSNDDFYKVPIYFASDWLNEFLIASSADDYRFVYIGQTGTWTPFHADVFNSFSWSANVCGRKKWILFPPGKEECLKDCLGNLPYDISQIYKQKKYFEVIQNPGEAIFVPSGWYHQVWNLEDTISVNHNWVNGCNIEKMWYAMEDNLNRVKKEIDDCKEMENFLNHCQIMLNAAFGMDFYKFYNFLEFIGKKRISFLENQTDGILFHGHMIGVNHAMFDLKAVKLVLEKFIQHTDTEELFTSQEKNLQIFNEKLNQFIKFTTDKNIFQK